MNITQNITKISNQRWILCLLVFYKCIQNFKYLLSVPLFNYHNSN